jgi:hypothetical protein
MAQTVQSPNPQIPPPATGIVYPPGRIREFTSQDRTLTPQALAFLQSVYVGLTGGDGVLPNISTLQQEVDALERGGPFEWSTPVDGSTVVAPSAERRRVLNPAGPLTSLTVQLPPSPLDMDFYDLSTTQPIVNFTAASPTGQIVNGAAFCFSANSGVSWMFRNADNTWYRHY